MATFYVGHRPVLRGRNHNDFVFPDKANNLGGTDRSVGVYSNYELFAPGLLTGAPDNDHVPGEGRHPHGLFWSRRYLGLDTKNPMDGSGGGTRLSYHRLRMLEYKGLAGAVAFPSTFGKTSFDPAYHYSNFVFDGIDAAEALKAPGHVVRDDTNWGCGNLWAISSLGK